MDELGNLQENASLKLAINARPGLHVSCGITRWSRATEGAVMGPPGGHMEAGPGVSACGAGLTGEGLRPGLLNEASRTDDLHLQLALLVHHANLDVTWRGGQRQQQAQVIAFRATAHVSWLNSNVNNGNHERRSAKLFPNKSQRKRADVIG